MRVSETKEPVVDVAGVSGKRPLPLTVRRTTAHTKSSTGRAIAASKTMIGLTNATRSAPP